MSQVETLGMPEVAISKDEKAFFVQLGARIAELRKAQNITQVQLAEWWGVSQQTVNAYEMAHRRVPAFALTGLAKFLGVSLEELVGEARQPGKRGPRRRFSSRWSASASSPSRSSAWSWKSSRPCSRSRAAKSAAPQSRIARVLSRDAKSSPSCFHTQGQALKPAPFLGFQHGEV